MASRVLTVDNVADVTGDFPGWPSSSLVAALSVATGATIGDMERVLCRAPRRSVDPALYRNPLPFHDGWVAVAGRTGWRDPSNTCVKTALAGRLLDPERDRDFVEGMVHHVSRVAWRASLVLQ